MMRGPSLGGPARADAPRRLQPVHLRHLHVHQDHVVGLPLHAPRAPRCRCRPRRPGSPVRSRIRSASFWFTDVVLGEQDAQRVAAAMPGIDPAAPAQAPALGERSPAQMPHERVEEARLAGPAWSGRRRTRPRSQPRPRAGPSELKQDQRQRRAGCARGSRCASVDAVHLRHVHVEDGDVERLALRRATPAPRAASPSARDCMPHSARLQDEHARLVALSSTTSSALALQLRLHADEVAVRAAGASAAGATRVKQKVEPLPAPSLSTHMRAAHQLDQPPADRQAEAGAAVLARGRGVGLREGLEERSDLVGGDADAGVAHGEREADASAGSRLARSPPAPPRPAR